MATHDNISTPRTSLQLSSADSPKVTLTLITLGARIRHARTTKGLTLAQLAEMLDCSPSFLSQVENGHREAKIGFLTKLTTALGVSLAELTQPKPPTERVALELELRQVQDSPQGKHLSIPKVHIGARLPNDALKALLASYKVMLHEGLERSPDAARHANVALHNEMRSVNNYLPEIEEMVESINRAVGHVQGPLLYSGVEDIARYLGFTLVYVEDLPNAARSITDLRHRRIYLSSTTRSDRDPRQIILRALGEQTMNHQIPATIYEHLQQRIRANYFATAILMPREATVAYLRAAARNYDISLSDLRDLCSVTYEMAAHRFTNLVTQFLDIPVHFLRVGKDGLIYKAYSNDGVVFPADSMGNVEGQLLCRHFGARSVFASEDPFGPHYQYTDTPKGTFWAVSQVESYRAGEFSICVGTTLSNAKYFRGHDTTHREVSRCPDPACCRVPSANLHDRWAAYAWPSVRAHSHLLAAMPPGAFPGLDDREVYEFLERHSRET